jgi:predicted transposase/invertase (TIGR01784 family)
MDKDKLSQSPHDQMFRACFSSPQAAQLLIFEHLPKHFSALFKPGSLTLAQGTFIDEKLSERRTDLLFRMKLKSGGEAYIYLLLEHKSRNDRLAPLQLLKYKYNVWSRLHKNGANALPPIIPVVFYHGVTPWSAPETFHGLIDGLDELLKPLTVQFSYILVDFGAIADEDLSQDRRQRLLLTALKYAPREDMREVGLKRVVSLFAGAPDVDVTLVLRYILTCHQGIGEDDVSRALIECAPECKDEVMNVWMKEIGEAAFAKGKAEGKAEGEARALLKVFACRFGETPEDVVRRVYAASPQTLDRWLERALDAKTISDVIDD